MLLEFVNRLKDITLVNKKQKELLLQMLDNHDGRAGYLMENYKSLLKL